MNLNRYKAKIPVSDGKDDGSCGNWIAGGGFFLALIGFATLGQEYRHLDPMFIMIVLLLMGLYYLNKLSKDELVNILVIAISSCVAVVSIIVLLFNVPAETLSASGVNFYLGSQAVYFFGIVMCKVTGLIQNSPNNTP